MTESNQAPLLSLTPEAPDKELDEVVASIQEKPAAPAAQTAPKLESSQLTPAERNAAWKELTAVYTPWLKMDDSDLPFYTEGRRWQRQSHIYVNPFYYIDYCLAQTVSLEFWAMIQKNKDDAWQHYMAYTRQGGSRTFTELLQNAGLESPFDESCLRGVCAAAEQWLDSFDMTGIL